MGTPFIFPHQGPRFNKAADSFFSTIIGQPSCRSVSRPPLPGFQDSSPFLAISAAVASRCPGTVISPSVLRTLARRDSVLQVPGHPGSHVLRVQLDLRHSRRVCPFSECPTPPSRTTVCFKNSLRCITLFCFRPLRFTARLSDRPSWTSRPRQFFRTEGERGPVTIL